MYSHCVNGIWPRGLLDLREAHIFGYLWVHVYYLHHFLRRVLLDKDKMPLFEDNGLEVLELCLPGALLRHQLLNQSQHVLYGKGVFVVVFAIHFYYICLTSTRITHGCIYGRDRARRLRC